MGLRNATVRRLAVPDMSTTVLTMTLTGIAADSSLAGGKNTRMGRRVASVVTMIFGVADVPPLPPTAAQSEVEAHDTCSMVVTPLGTVRLVQVDPPSVVVTMALPTAIQSELVEHETPRKL